MASHCNHKKDGGRKKNTADEWQRNKKRYGIRQVRYRKCKHRRIDFLAAPTRDLSILLLLSRRSLVIYALFAILLFCKCQSTHFRSAGTRRVSKLIGEKKRGKKNEKAWCGWSGEKKGVKDVAGDGHALLYKLILSKCGSCAVAMEMQAVEITHSVQYEGIWTWPARVWAGSKRTEE